MDGDDLPDVAEHEDAPEGGAETQDTPEQQPDKPFDVESFAGRMGWAPKDQWRGDPDDWKPADKFLEDTVSYNRSLAKEVKHLKRSHERTARTIESIAEQRIADERAKLEARLEQAVDEGDREAVRHVTTQISQLEQQRPQSAPEVEDFAQRHAEWFNVDPEATALAIGVAENLARQGKSAADQVAAAERAVKRRFPELFGEPEPRRQTKPPAAVHSADTRSAPRHRSGPKGFADLPAADKEVALRMEARGRCTRDEYATMYWQENA